MIDTQKGIEACKRIVTRSVILDTVKNTGRSMEYETRAFLVSDTYKLVQDTETRLWAESPLYVAEWYRSERESSPFRETYLFHNPDNL